MKRRDLLMLAIAAGATSRLAYAQSAPCPPPQLGIDTGAATTNVCSSSGSVLADAAGSMAPGSWLQMTNPIPSGLSLFTGQPGVSGLSIAYCSKFARDAANKKFYFVGSDHNGPDIFLSYSEATNSWTQVSAPVPWGYNGGGTPAHGYEGSTFDSANGKFWHNPPYGTVIRDWGGASWGTVNASPPLFYTASTGCAEFFPERGRILIFQVENGTNATLAEVNPVTRTATALVDQTTGTLSGAGGYSCFMRYSAARKVVYFGGGNGSNRVWSVNAAGAITRHDDLPPGIATMGPAGNGSRHPTINVANGNLIGIGSASTWYELNPNAASGSQWGSKSGTAQVLSSNTVDGSAYGCMSCAVPEYGVVAFVKNYSQSSPAQMWLWKP